MSSIGIIDCGMGNTFSVFNAVDHLGGDPVVCSLPEDLERVDKIIFPGVGAFNNCMEKLDNLKLIEPLNDLVLKKKVPILGICLGMQVMAQKGDEGGEVLGLGWLDAEVKRLTSPNVRIPHVGWDDIKVTNENELIAESFDQKDFYFVHSYAMSNQVDGDVAATCEYGEAFTVAINRENIYGVQFHPEKSQSIGLELLDRFVWEL